MDLEYRGYYIKPYKLMPSSYNIATVGKGGKIPAVLEGLFTSVGIAKDCINAYILTKEVKNGKAGNES